MNTIEEFDDYLTSEINEFEKVAKFALEKGLVRYGTYAAGCRDLGVMVRSVLRTTLLQNRLEGGEVIMAFVARKLYKKVENKQKTT